MPAVASGKVLVTGATGFVAGCIMQSLLQSGFSVRGTVRTESKGKALEEKLGEKFEFAIVEDMVKDGAFDEAVRGVDAVMHVASSVHLQADDPNELIHPAVAGTLGVLESAKRCGDSVRRVIYTSSCATVITTLPEFRVFNEEDWNDAALKEVGEKGRTASPMDKYRASKTYAERAAWHFMEEHKAELKFDFVTIHPPWIFGPVLLASTPEALSTSMKTWFDSVCGIKDDNYLATVGGEWVNAKDVALAHIRSLQRESAGGNRIITSAGPYKWRHWFSTARALDEKLPGGNRVFEDPVYDYAFDASKSVKLLDLQYISMEQTTKEILAQFKELGWIA